MSDGLVYVYGAKKPEEEYLYYGKGKERKVVLLSDIAKSLAEKGVPIIKKFIEDLRMSDKAKFKQAMKETGIEVL
jgi:carbamoylphosphate synthase large subunit